jgi:hypothetical protein
MSGHLARVGAWEPVFERPIDALCDRFPSQGRSAVWAAAIGGAGALPFGNPPSFTELCRDKLVAQRVLEASGVEMPAVEADPARFRERLAEWGAAFLKPRYGSLGAGVRRVTVGDALPAIVEAVGDQIEVWMDGGIRSGQDVLKAWALGARGTLIGRAMVYGLGAMGEAGVTKALEIIHKELDITMAFCGHTQLQNVDKSILLPGTFPQA